MIEVGLGNSLRSNTDVLTFDTAPEEELKRMASIMQLYIIVVNSNIDKSLLLHCVLNYDISVSINQPLCAEEETREEEDKNVIGRLRRACNIALSAPLDCGRNVAYITKTHFLSKRGKDNSERKRLSPASLLLET